jgi:hypothetical protein
VQNLIKFEEVYEQFVREVETDINKGASQLNIDYYMRDLRKHAMEEYSEVYQIEQAIIAESSAIYEQAPNMDQEERTEHFVADYNEKLNQRYGFLLDAKEKKKLKRKQRKKDKKIKQQLENENPFQVEDGLEEENLYDYITTAVSNE